jgi:hypothetical protein
MWEKVILAYKCVISTFTADIQGQQESNLAGLPDIPRAEKGNFRIQIIRVTTYFTIK